MLRRTILALLVTAAAWLLPTATGAVAVADAHAELRGSTPAGGAALTRAPQQVVITFTEEADPTLSTIHVFDAHGRQLSGQTMAVMGAPLQLRAVIVAAQLAKAPGAYTVRWRSVSKDDGHVASGAFTYTLSAGGGTASGAPAARRAPAATAAPAPSSASGSSGWSSSQPLLGVAGRWALYWALALLVGAASTGLFVLGDARRRRVPVEGGLLLAPLLLGILGLVAMIVAEHAAVGSAVSLQALMHAGAGRDTARVALAFAPAAIATVLLAADPGSPRRLWLLGGSAALAMLVLAVGGHAAAPSSLRPLNLLAQWAHLVAVGVWIGGLAWLLAALYRQDRAVQIVAAVRFSRVATLALAAVAVTGLERALSELGSWHALFGSSFGRMLDLKVLLFGVLVAFGTYHHFRVVPTLPHDPGGLALLRRGLRGELGVAGLVLLATASLSQLPPGSAASTPMAMTTASHAPATPSIGATGRDATASVRVALQVTPGHPGANVFAAKVINEATGTLLPVRAVQLRLALPARPDLGASTLDLAPGATGVWHARSGALSLDGRWTITALITTATGPVAVALQLRTTPAPPQAQAVGYRP